MPGSLAGLGTCRVHALHQRPDIVVSLAGYSSGSNRRNFIVWYAGSAQTQLDRPRQQTKIYISVKSAARHICKLSANSRDSKNCHHHRLWRSPDSAGCPAVRNTSGPAGAMMEKRRRLRHLWESCNPCVLKFAARRWRGLIGAARIGRIPPALYGLDVAEFQIEVCSGGACGSVRFLA